MDPEAHLHVLNPISVEQSLMRMSLLPGLHRNIVENAKRFDEFRLFEIGNEIHKRAKGFEEAVGEILEGEAGRSGANGLPEEVPHLMATVYAKGDGVAGLFELKRLAESILPGCEVRPTTAVAYEHPARTGEVHWRGALVGRLYEIHPKLMEEGRAAILDINLKTMYGQGPLPHTYQPLRRFPSSGFDLSVTAGLRVLVGDVRSLIQSAAGSNCDQVEYLYSYKGAPLAEDQQSLTYRVTLSAADRTLTTDEVNATGALIVEALKQGGYELRG
jgi:phenylalanyl-tRNA synthetase beta chain